MVNVIVAAVCRTQTAGARSRLTDESGSEAAASGCGWQKGLPRSECAPGDLPPLKSAGFAPAKAGQSLVPLDNSIEVSASVRAFAAAAAKARASSSA